MFLLICAFVRFSQILHLFINANIFISCLMAFIFLLYLLLLNLIMKGNGKLFNYFCRKVFVNVLFFVFIILTKYSKVCTSSDWWISTCRTNLAFILRIIQQTSITYLNRDYVPLMYFLCTSYASYLLLMYFLILFMLLMYFVCTSYVILMLLIYFVCTSYASCVLIMYFLCFVLLLMYFLCICDVFSTHNLHNSTRARS